MCCRPILYSFLKKNYLFIFGEREREGERERNIDVWLPLVCLQLGTWPATQACALPGNRTCDPLIHRPAFNPARAVSFLIYRGGEGERLCTMFHVLYRYIHNQSFQQLCEIGSTIVSIVLMRKLRLILVKPLFQGTQ